jgi:uroporphyrinogen decarboxylase
MIWPYQKEMYDFVHRSCPQVKVLLHSCGAIFDLIPDLIEAGVDMLNPVQISAKGMEPQRLKDAYGNSIFFWGGGADIQNFVEHTDNLEEIQDHVERLVKIFSANGGFVFSQVHNFQHDVDIGKVLAIYEIAKRYKVNE